MSANWYAAGNAKAAIKDMLLNRGGIAEIKFNGNRRIISHNPILDRPIRTLPWPLKLLQAYNIHYSVFVDDVEVSVVNFNRSTVNDAIEAFLNNIDPSQKVLVVWSRE